ncbi:DUF4870 domain-containing protein [Curtobacterium sp. RRHDQ10]|uniref:DUF4870 domain-containing protein n=1 Tax=Curtobacterium phyllosphaerae TaxID=3413379 RepID=UPI003BEFDDE7
MTATPPNDNGPHGQPDHGQQAPGNGHQSEGQGSGQSWQQQPGYDQGYQQGYGYAPPPPLRPEDQRLWSTLTHLSGIFFNFVGPLVAYLVLRDRGPFVREHTRVALNFHITMAIAYFVGGLLSIIFIGFLVVAAAGIVSLVFSIMAAVKANAGEFYRYPLSIEFFKQ